MGKIMRDLYREPLVAKVGDYVKPNRWPVGNHLLPGDPYLDGSFKGCQFRLLSVGTRPVPIRYAVNVTITGRKVWGQGFYRCRIEFVGDGEPSVFTGGRIWPLQEVA